VSLGGIEKCSSCSFEKLEDKYVAQCKSCEVPYIVAHFKSDYELGIARDVCDWSVRVRSKNCKYSDLTNRENCLECQEGFFYDSKSKLCEPCNSRLEGCAECNSDATKCELCLPDFDLKMST